MNRLSVLLCVLLAGDGDSGLGTWDSGLGTRDSGDLFYYLIIQGFFVNLGDEPLKLIPDFMLFEMLFADVNNT
ncbi:MAG: hypothetical protein U9N86_19200 [Bacteroidota bacterium]|nr:hypothetical protein [Bacteroidota bacterium]